MTVKTLQLSTVPVRRDLAMSNCVFVSNKDLALLGAVEEEHIQVNSLIYIVKSHEEISEGTIALNLYQRKTLFVGLHEKLTVCKWTRPSERINLARLTLEVDLAVRCRDSCQIDAESLGTKVANSFKKHVVSIGQLVLIHFMGQALALRITALDVHNGKGASSRDETSEVKDEDLESVPLGIIDENTQIFASSTSTLVKLINVQQNSMSRKIFRPDFSFSKMGVGGLDQEIGDIFRRAFASRVYPASVLAKMGLMHVRGVLLFGAPGCGKTLIARKIGKMLVDKEPKVVNGPEILSKWVGQAEENVRNLFSDARREMNEKGDESQLHVIIFDEIDAICRQRGTKSGDAGVGDSVVNQLLSYIDGVNALNNILVIGMTNRKDMLDEALLRPGRLEVHVEIGLPDENGRAQILSIHTGGMKNNGYLDDQVSVEDLARMTKNYTGAEIEGVCKAAASYAFERNIDTTSMNRPLTMEGIRVTMDDFKRAVIEIKPAFGVSTADLEDCMPEGIINYGPRFDRLVETGSKFLAQIRESKHTSLVSVLLEGPPGAGKTALAAYLATQAEFPYIKLLSPEVLVNQSESARCFKITKTFEDAYRSPLAVIVLDNIERLVGYVKIGPHFSNELLQTLLVLVKRRPPKGHRLLLIGTTSNLRVLEQLELAGDRGSFTTTLQVPALDRLELVRVMQDLGCFQPEAVEACAGAVDEVGIGMKQLLMVAEMAKQGSRGERINTQAFRDALCSYGL